MKVKPKFVNRTISIICLAVFVVGLVLLGYGSYKIISLYNQNQKLTSIRDNLQTTQKVQNQYEQLHYDEYYSVYVEDGYALYDDKENEPLIFFTK